MDSVVRAVVEAIHASPTQAVLCLSGGASQALGWLLSVPRASSTVLEVTVPYSRISMLQYLGKAPLQFVSRESAEDIALAAYNRALRLSMPGWYLWKPFDHPQSGVPVAGIGFTGALASATPKRGDHRCYVAARTQTGLWECNLTLSKTLADVCGVSLELPLGLDDGVEKLNVSNKNFTEDEQLEHLVEGKTSMVSYAQSEDKPPLSLVSIKQRVKQFRDIGKTLVLTNQPYFYKKAELLPDSTFVVGVDTAIRLINPKYYGESRERMLEVLLGIKHLGCDFLVAGRKVGEKFQVLGDLNVPEPVQELFRAIPDDSFRVDISSTELRETNDKA
ncbi:hypothetical protein AXG93_1962s1430 [Marchantia polymorpha subsp. ruderalis]|uniref:Uncharacterized protein n=1 Tax=Marchantia polymorpha subsp. ruderalis TaxID=1480154 RepID=A0A176WGL1_MARPO|nr:hypothetical protein AXG93_1962s1430 [Marchantia polymorpha subsp. ruderalis]